MRAKGVDKPGITHCPYGHEYTEDNTYRNKRGHRNCKTCMRRQQKEYRARVARRNN